MEKHKIGYALGLNVARNLQDQGFDDFDIDSFKLGLKHHLNDEEKEMAEEEIAAVLRTAFIEIQSRKHGPVVESGKLFLTENAKKAGVSITESGLQYRVLAIGSGRYPKPSDMVTTHYHGMLIDGTVFDSSVTRGEPATFPVDGVIMGWQEALPMMREGDKWELVIPYELAYGENGAGNSIPPFSTLIFEVELISIN